MNGLESMLIPERIGLDVEITDLEGVLDELARLLGGSDEAAREAIRDDLRAREEMSTTGVGGGIAFPHARVDFLAGIRLAVLRTREPVEFGSTDGRGVDLFVGVAGPMQERRDYLAALGKLSYLFRASSAREGLREASSASDVLGLLGRGLPDSDRAA